MTLAEKLQNLAESQPCEGRRLINIPDDGAGWSAALTADRTDVVGCLVWELTLQRSTRLEGGAAELQEWASRAAHKVNSLLEPLKVLEVDATRGEAILRSQQPTVRGDDLFYFEVLLRDSGSARLQRFKAHRQPDSRREQVAFAMSYDALAKAANDLTCV